MGLVKNGSHNCVQNNTHLHEVLGQPIILKRCETGRPNWQTLLEQICQRRKVRSLGYHFRTRRTRSFHSNHQTWHHYSILLFTFRNCHPNHFREISHSSTAAPHWRPKSSNQSVINCKSVSVKKYFENVCEIYHPRSKGICDNFTGNVEDQYIKYKFGQMKRNPAKGQLSLSRRTFCNCCSLETDFQPHVLSRMGT